jgi:Flp pilus assembly protein TadG
MDMLLKTYRRAVRGSVSVVFAFAAIGLVLAAGVAIDLERQHDWESRLQSAADTAALAGASKDGSAEQRQAAARSFFTSNFAHDEVIAEPDVAVTVVDEVVKVTATSTIKTSMLGLAGIESMPLKAESEASTGGSTVEIALVLDVSGSMRHALSGSTARIDVLKSAARQLLDIVSDHGKKMSRVKIGIVPFNMSVNVGTGNSGFVQGAGNALFAGQSWAGCVMERAGADATSDNYVSGSAGSNGKWFAYAWPPEPNNKTGSCLNRSNGTNAGYIALDAPSGYAVNRRGPNFNCVRHPIMALSSTYRDVTAKIDQLTAEWNQGTIVAPGVSWGLRVLSPDAPFTEGSKYDPKVAKYMIVLTDGEQTTEAEYGTQGNCGAAQNTGTAYQFNPSSQGLDGSVLSKTGPRDTYSPYGYIRDSDPFHSGPSNWNDVAKDLYNVSMAACTAAKTASKESPIQVFTIAVSSDAGSGTLVNDLLKKCASTEQDFYLATNDAGLTGAFRAIAAKINQVRLMN